jgi:hypothetical protein
MEAIGVRRYSDYLRGTLSVGVSRDEELVLTPELNTGMKNGLVALADEVERLALTTTTMELGSAIRRAFERAR